MNNQLKSLDADRGGSASMLVFQESNRPVFDFWGVLRQRKWLVFWTLLVGAVYSSQCLANQRAQIADQLVLSKTFDDGENGQRNGV